ncbi:FAD-binding protein [uncultured Sutterella sp.]|uniref:FAD-binding protein n=2 Tax=uncultured Sutterella sp. TaxID=286133 RepID=UPI003420B716
MVDSVDSHLRSFLLPAGNILTHRVAGAALLEALPPGHLRTVRTGNGGAPSGYMTATFGGPKIKAKGQVLNAEQQPVPGLYAAGNAIGGLFYWNYIVGSQLTAAVIFGRRAAQDAAARAKAKAGKKA